MRHITHIAIHCSAGFGSLESVKKFWKEKLKWQTVGYHYFIDTNGKVTNLLPIANISNGVQGFNASIINICYQGGVLKEDVKKAADSRTVAQKQALESTIKLVLNEVKKYQDIDDIAIQGHRDFSPDKNKNGIIESWERIKECPSFDAIPEYRNIISSLLNK